jgi:hypothetical protein
MLSKETIAYSRKLAPIILMLDEQYTLETGETDGLVVQRLPTAEVIKPAKFESYDHTRETLRQLKAEAAELPEPDRRMYYDQMCGSLLGFIDWRVRDLPFTEQIPQFIHVPARPASDEELDTLRGKMRETLTRMGYSGDLAKQCADWEAKVRVPADEVPGVLEHLMNEAWDRAEQYLFKIPAEKSDRMRVIPVSGVPFNAMCNYAERRVHLNVDPVLTRPGLKHLTVHEGIPGHYLQFKMRETGLLAGEGALDGSLSVVNTAGASVFEGIADNGLRMLNWFDSDDDIVQSLMNRYRAGIGTGAAWRLHALHWEPEKVADWLRSQSLVGGEGWIANRMAFISAPARAVLIWSYWWGEAVVAPIWEGIPSAQRPGFLKFMYDRVHSNESIAMYTPGRKEESGIDFV